MATSDPIKIVRIPFSSSSAGKHPTMLVGLCSECPSAAGVIFHPLAISTIRPLKGKIVVESLLRVRGRFVSGDGDGSGDVRSRTRCCSLLHRRIATRSRYGFS
jgi:hypothetical protein